MGGGSTPEIRAKKILGFRDVFFPLKIVVFDSKIPKFSPAVECGALFFSSFALEFSYAMSAILKFSAARH